MAKKQTIKSKGAINMRSLEFSTEQIKAMRKFLGGLDMSTFETTDLDQNERTAVLDGFGVFVGEDQEIAIDESYTNNKVSN